MKKIIDKIFITTFFLILTACAVIVPPSGGDRDVEPPSFIKSTPPNYSKNFNESKVRIYFNEYINLNDVNGQVVISPPIENIPEFKLRGKSLVFSIDEQLKDNMTYTIYFGNAIEDFTENNTMLNFQYVLSTGAYIDSLSISGNVSNAFTLEKEKNILVMLYNEKYDSVPYKEKPYYVSKTDENGKFHLDNLAQGNYKIFALEDANNNYIYDLPNERIAFIDSLLPAEIIHKTVVDTNVTDSLISDSTIIKNINYEMFLFEEADTIQRILKSKAVEIGRLKFIFKESVKNLKIKPLNHKFENEWKLDEFNLTKDTLNCWLTNVEVDSLILEISDDGEILDTVELALKTKGNMKKKDLKLLPTSLTLSPNVRNNRSFDFYKSLQITFSEPIASFDFLKIVLAEKVDTIYDTLKPVMFFKDSVIKRNLEIDYDFEMDRKYSLFIPPSAFKGISELENDTLKLSFSTTELENYGIILLKMQLPETPDSNYIVQLLDSKENVLKEKFIKSNGLIKFEFLNPGKYKLKAFSDVNNNLKWDTGDYMKGIRAEKVFYFPKDITIRANWDLELDWDLLKKEIK